MRTPSGLPRLAVKTAPKAISFRHQTRLRADFMTVFREQGNGSWSALCACWRQKTASSMKGVQAMSQKPIVQECDQEVQALLPTLPRPEQKALAGLVCGVVLSQASTLAQASAAIPGQEQDRSKHRRAQRLLANRRLDVPDAQQHLLRRVLHSQVGRRSRLDLLVDAVHTGATAHWGGLVTLLVALAWRHRAIPLVWCTRLASDPAQDWQADLAQLLARVQVGVEQVWAAQPRPLVVVLADRGLSGDKLAHTALALGWHFLLRVRRRVAYQAASGQIGTLGTWSKRRGHGCA
jgi:hypothetical protein